MEFEGTVYKIMPVTKGTSARGEWQRQDVVFEMNEGSFTRKICVTFFNKPDDVARLKEGAAYNVSVNIESREYNGRWYTDIRAWRIQSKQQEPAAARCPTCPRLSRSRPMPPRLRRRWMTCPSDPGSGAEGWFAGSGMSDRLLRFRIGIRHDNPFSLFEKGLSFIGESDRRNRSAERNRSAKNPDGGRGRKNPDVICTSGFSVLQVPYCGARFSTRCVPGTISRARRPESRP